MTIYELAKQLGVAPATVSKALNGTGRMKTETRERIVAFARDANYNPSSVASNLRKSRTNTIGIIVPRIGMNVFSAVVQQAEQYAAARDYNAILITTDASLEREKEAVGMLLRRRVEGVIAVPYGVRETLDCAHFRMLTNAGIPVVVAEQDMPGIEFPKVMIDNRGGAKMLTDYLLQLGHRRILMPVFNTEKWNRSGLDRVAGYYDAFLKHGMAADPAMVIDYTAERLPEIVGMIKTGAITAIFAVCDSLAMNIISGLAAAGIKPPEDVSVGGFDNISAASVFLPALTTVDQPMDRFGREAAAMLFQMIDARNPALFSGKTVTIPCSLEVRNSCRPILNPNI